MFAYLPSLNVWGTFIPELLSLPIVFTKSCFQPYNSNYLFLSSQDRIFSLFPNGATAPSGSGPPCYRGFMIILRQTTLGRTPLDEWSARHRHLYLTTHNTHKRQTSMPPAGFEVAIPASERPQTHALDRTDTGIGKIMLYTQFIFQFQIL
jgi:hypothetical protein